MSLGADRDSLSVASPLAQVTEAGFADWLRPHLAALTAVARREVGMDSGDDVVQETIVQAWRYRARFDPARGSPRAWLMTILLDKARRHRRRLRWVDRLPVSAGPVDDGQDARALDSATLEAAIGRLSRRQQQVVVLHYLADLPVSAVAEVLGVSESSVKTHLGHARSALRAFLIGDEDEH